MIDKVINNKISWLILGTILVVMIVVLIYPKNEKEDYTGYNGSSESGNKIEDKIIFKLIGEEEVTINLKEEYKDEGYIALLNDNTDLSKNVDIKNTIDYSKAGTYEIIYTLSYKGETKELKRKVMVKGVDEKALEIKLKGKEIVYLNVNEEYEEEGAIATYNKEDISEYVKTEGEINTSKEGNYEIKYTIEKENIKKEVIRKVKVFDIEGMFEVDKENLIINITMNSNFSYIRLPSGIVNQNEVISYKVESAGNYEFSLFTKDYKEYKKIVKVELSGGSQVPSEPVSGEVPNGTCKAVLKDGKTIVTVKSNSNIVKYNYNGVESNSSVYNVDKYLRESNVILTGKNGKTKKITCNVKMETMPVNKPSGTIKYKQESDTLKVYITKKSGFFVSFIWMKDPVYQMKKYLVPGTNSKSVFDLMKDAVKKDTTLKDKIVLGFNGAWYSSDRYKKNSIYKYEHTPLVVYNGTVVQNDYEKYQSSVWVYYINSSNQLSYIPSLNDKNIEERKQIFQAAIDDGAYNTLGFGSGPLLVQNGIAKTTYNKNSAAEYNAYRQGLCQIDANNYILVTSDSGRTKNTVIFAQMMEKLGCKTAINIDGGGSTTLLYKPKGTNIVSKLKGTTRSRPVVMYFTELN